MMAWSLEDAISYYQSQGAPGDQNVLIHLLREVQQEMGGRIPVFLITQIAHRYEIKEGILLALVKRIPSLRLAEVHCLELCAGPSCGKHHRLAEYARKLQEKSEQKFELKFVPCMRMCAKGPNIRWDGTQYNRATAELLEELIQKASKT